MTEAEAVRKQLPNVHISIASKRKRSGGKTYYLEESSAAMRLIAKLRNNFKEEQ